MVIAISMQRFRLTRFQLRAVAPQFGLAGIPAGPMTRKVSLDEFLGSLCLIFSGKSVATVGDIIRLCSHAKGGVHVGKPEKSGPIAITEFEGMFPEHRRESAVFALASIGTALLEGLEPLVIAIQSQGQ